MKKGRTAVDDREDNVRIQEFLDMIAPSVIKFETDHFICGNTYRCVWALREYPTATEEQAILSHLGEKDGVTLRIYTRHVTPPEARNTLIEHNLRLVAHIVKKYYFQHADQDDLISIGTIGLIKGISSFDPAKGARLATYAARCIENTILT